MYCFTYIGNQFLAIGWHCDQAGPLPCLGEALEWHIGLALSPHTSKNMGFNLALCGWSLHATPELVHVSSDTPKRCSLG